FESPPVGDRNLFLRPFSADEFICGLSFGPKAENQNRFPLEFIEGHSSSKWPQIAEAADAVHRKPAVRKLDSSHRRAEAGCSRARTGARPATAHPPAGISRLTSRARRSSRRSRPHTQTAWARSFRTTAG